MKNLYRNAIFAMAILATTAVTAQTQNVGIGTTQPDKSAVLDIQSADKGLLIPRMDLQSRNKITNPANGLLIFQTDDNSGFYFYDKNSWKPLTTTEANAIATGDVNGWALDGNHVAVGGIKAKATAVSYIGTPSDIPINFKIGSFKAGEISINNLLLGNRVGINMTGTSNVGLGLYSMGYVGSGMSGNTNVGIGVNALASSTTATSNMALGSNSLRYNTTGSNNLGIGTNALLNNTVGRFNTAIGSQALYTNGIGDYNVSIGTNSGFSSTGSNNIFIGYRSGYNESGSNKLYISNSDTPTPLIYGDFAAKYVTIGDVSPALRAQGIATGGYNLLVKGGILTEKIKVALASAGSDWADYVFEPDYKLMSLEDVEQFTLANKHLPNVPSAEEMVKGGLDVAETSKMFMEKIEELTLYMIELNKEVKALKVENQQLKASLNK